MASAEVVNLSRDVSLVFGVRVEMGIRIRSIDVIYSLRLHMNLLADLGRLAAIKVCRQEGG